MIQEKTPPRQSRFGRSSMGFFEHFDELRARLLRCLTVFFVGFVALYFVSEPILDFLRAPLFKVLPTDQQKLYFTSLFENFLTHLKVAGYASLLFLCPYYFYELWAFVSPGLYPRERRLALPFVLAAAAFFIGGALFAYYILFPVGFRFFVTYGAPSDVPLLTIDSYYGTCLKLMLLFGIAFELPVLICLLGFIGVIDSQTLRVQRKNAIIGITVIAALFVPPDAVSMLMLGAPLVLFYEISILVVERLRGSRARGHHEDPMETNPLEGRSQP